MSLETLKPKVAKLIEKAQSGGKITAGFTSEKYKNWLAINGYTVVEFTLTSRAENNLVINHPLSRPAKSIVCFRADLDGKAVNDKVCFAISANGTTADNKNNRLSKIPYPEMFFVLTSGADNEFRGILENTADYITLRFVQNGQFNYWWESGDYYLAVL